MNAMMLLSELTALPDLTGLSTAGIMGAMWLWERRNSRQREEQLDTAHQRILSDRVRLEQLIALVRQNTQALTTLAERLGPPQPAHAANGTHMP